VSDLLIQRPFCHSDFLNISAAVTPIGSRRMARGSGTALNAPSAPRKGGRLADSAQLYPEVSADMKTCGQPRPHPCKAAAGRLPLMRRRSASHPRVLLEAFEKEPIAPSGSRTRRPVDHKRDGNPSSPRLGVVLPDEAWTTLGRVGRAPEPRENRRIVGSMGLSSAARHRHGCASPFIEYSLRVTAMRLPWLARGDPGSRAPRAGALGFEGRRRSAASQKVAEGVDRQAFVHHIAGLPGDLLTDRGACHSWNPSTRASRMICASLRGRLFWGRPRWRAALLRLAFRHFRRVRGDHGGAARGVRRRSP